MTDRELLVAAALIAVAAGTAIAVAWWMVVLVAVAALIVRHRFVVCLLGIVGLDVGRSGGEGGSPTARRVRCTSG